MKRCKGNVRELLALELFAKGPAWGLWTPFLANQLRTVKQAISASLADVVKRVPGQSKGKAEAREKTGGKPRLGYPIRNYPPAFSRASALSLRGASRRQTGEAGRPGTAAGVIQSTRGSYLHRRPAQHRGLLLCSFLLRRKRVFPFLFRGDSFFASWLLEEE